MQKVYITIFTHEVKFSWWFHWRRHKMKTSHDDVTILCFCYMAISKGLLLSFYISMFLSISRFQNKKVLDHLIRRLLEQTWNILESTKYCPHYNYYLKILVYWKFLILNKDAEVNENNMTNHIICSCKESFKGKACNLVKFLYCRANATSSGKDRAQPYIREHP